MDYKKDCLEFLKKLIATKSYSRMEKTAAKLVAAEMKKLKYDAVFTDDRYHNVAGIIGRGKLKILYDAHTDTVTVPDASLWKSGPFTPVVRHGRLYGRGAADDKGSVAAMVYGGGLIAGREHISKNSGDFTLMVSASSREEIGETQWLDFIVRKLKFKPDFVVIGEPSALKIIVGHKGRAELKISVGGKSVHASVPDEGINAVQRAAELINKISSLNPQYKTGLLGRPVISVTKIQTPLNASINTIPDRCEFYIDRRTIETESRQSVRREIENILARPPRKGTARIEYFKFYSPWIIDRKHPLVRAAVGTFHSLFKSSPQVVTWPFCTNGSFTMGERGIPTIGFGPGEETEAHIIDESVPIEEIFKAMDFYRTLPYEISQTTD